MSDELIRRSKAAIEFGKEWGINNGAEPWSVVDCLEKCVAEVERLRTIVDAVTANGQLLEGHAGPCVCIPYSVWKDAAEKARTK